jgi:hypothetical protein
MTRDDTPDRPASLCDAVEMMRATLGRRARSRSERADLHVGDAEVSLTVRHPTGGCCGRGWTTARLRVAHPAAFTVDERPSWWSFEPPGDHDDVLGEAIAAARGHLGLLGVPRVWRDAGPAGRRAAISRLAAEAASLAWARCDPTARATAIAFAPPARSYVYAGLLADARGHLARVVETWPGLLALGAAHTHGHAEIMRLLLDGRSVRDVLDGTLGKLRDRPGARRMVREAPIDLDGSVLRDAIAGPAIDVNDLPFGPDARRTWYRWAATWRRVIEGRPQGSPIRFGGFVSRHALELEAIARAERADAAALLSSLLERLDRTGAPVPDRASSPAREMARLRAWQETPGAAARHRRE